MIPTVPGSLAVVLIALVLAACGDGNVAACVAGDNVAAGYNTDIDQCPRVPDQKAAERSP